MRRLIFTVMVAASACSHAANWSRIAINNVGTVEEVTTDVDLTSIRFRDGYRQAWSRFSYTTEQIDPLNPGGKRYLTLMYLGLYDCKNAEAARIALAVYTDRFGGGRFDKTNRLIQSRRYCRVTCRPSWHYC